jgi:hypothetical protein
MADERVIATGQWLGSGNTVGHLQQFKYGWKMWDGTGATYRQPDFPDGLKTWDVRTDGRTEAPRTPWPMRS